MPLPNIHEIRIKGYKSLADETRLEIRPLTILAGANSSGKSSVMQPLLLLKQTLASPSDPGVMELAGPNVQFTKYEQMFYRCPGKGKSVKTMKIGFSVGDPDAPETIDITYRLSANQLHLEKEEFSTYPKDGQHGDFTLRTGLLSEKESSAVPKHVFGMGRPYGRSIPQNMVYKCQVQRGFLDVMVGKEGAKFFMMLGAPTTDRAVRQQLLNLIHIPGLRGNPERDYPLRKTKGPRFDGHFQDYVAGIVAGWKDGVVGKLKLARLSDALHELGLTWKLEARSLDATRVEIVVGRLKDARQGGAKDLVNIADVGLGVSQILPALVALMTASPNQLIHLEQPEIHLHPKAQKNLAKILGQAATSKKRLIVETHSSILIRGIQTLVAKGELDPKLVKLHWFTRDDETGATKVSSADLDDNGAFGADWPEDFDDTYLESERDYLDAVEARYQA
jgi:AAA domain, putative AbiEii toxin, Type IV TA system/AAA ATPase domain/Protein of unknown function (DUF3696)